MKQSIHKKFSQVSLCDNRNCQSTKSLYDGKNYQSTKSLCDDKSCTSTKCIHMWPVKSEMKSSYMHSVKPAMKQSTYKKFSQVSRCDDKNYQSTIYVHMQPVEPSMPQSRYKKVTQSTHLQSVSKTARKQLWAHPEVPRNIKHTILHVCDQQTVCIDSTSKSCYPSRNTNMCLDSGNLKIQSNHMWPVQAELHKVSKVTTR